MFYSKSSMSFALRMKLISTQTLQQSFFLISYGFVSDILPMISVISQLFMFLFVCFVKMDAQQQSDYHILFPWLCCTTVETFCQLKFFNKQRMVFLISSTSLFSRILNQLLPPWSGVIQHKSKQSKR